MQQEVVNLRRGCSPWGLNDRDKPEHIKTGRGAPASRPGAFLKSKSLAVSELTEPLPQSVEIGHIQDCLGGRRRPGQPDLGRALGRLQLLGVIEIGRPAAGARANKSLDALSL